MFDALVVALVKVKSVIRPSATRMLWVGDIESWERSYILIN